MNNKNMTITLLVILILIVIVLIWFMISSINGRFRLNFKKTSEEKVLEEIYTQQFEKIDVTADASLIEIKTSITNEFKLVIYGKEDLLNVYPSSNELKVEINSEKCFGICFHTTMSKAILYVPQNYTGKINLVNKFGDVEIEDIKNSEVILDVSCGNIDIGKVKNADIKNRYGDITVEEVEYADIKADCGDIDVSKIHSGKIKNKLGDIKIGSIIKRIEIDEDCGNVEIDSLTIENDSYIYNSLGDIKIGDTNEIFIDAKTSLGDVKINENYRQANTILKIENSAGDIIIKN